MGKQTVRKRPIIRSVQRDIERDEHQMCDTPGCRNVIAVWAIPRDILRAFCSRCRKEKR